MVNDELKISELSFDKGADGKLKFKSIQISFSKPSVCVIWIDDNPVVSKSGLIVGPEYEGWVRSQLPEAT